MRRTRARTSPASTTSGILLIAAGAVLAAVSLPVPKAVSDHLSVPAVGLVLVWSGVLLLGMKAYLYRPRRRRALRTGAAWYEHDVRAPGDLGRATRGGTYRRP